MHFSPFSPILTLMFVVGGTPCLNVVNDAMITNYLMTPDGPSETRNESARLYKVWSGVFNSRPDTPQSGVCRESVSSF